MRRKPGERWRWRLKVAIAAALASARLGPLRAILARRPRRPLIIGYHRVVDDFATAAETENPTMLISRFMFERHLDWIGRHFRFATLDEVGQQIASGRPVDEPVAAITFDDGYRDIYEHAFPVLKRKGIPAAVFVVTNLVGGAVWQIHDRLYNVMARAFQTWDDPGRELFGLLDELGIAPVDHLRAKVTTKSPSSLVSSLLPALPQAAVGRVIRHLEAGVGCGLGQVPLSLTWPMIAEMRQGGMTFGSHTRTHVSLPLESPNTIDEELAGSRRELERGLGDRVAHFAYPGGHFNAEVVDATYRAGYQFAYTACTHRDHAHPELTIERLLLWEGSSIDADGHFSPDILDCQAHDLWLPARKCERIHQV